MPFGICKASLSSWVFLTAGWIMVQSQETTVAPPIEPQEVTSPEPSISEGPEALPAAIVIEPMSADTLNLANGDVLSGRLEQYDYPGDTSWNRSDIQQAFAFDSQAVHQIRLGDRAKTTPELSPSMTLQLSNGDQLSGIMESLDDTVLKLNTSFGGTLDLPADQVQWAVFHRQDQSYLYEGPSGLDGWTVGEVNTAQLDGGQWAYRNGSFYATKAASIARMVGMPNRMQLEFDLEWKGSLNIAVALYTDYLQPVSLAEKDSEPDFGGFYSLQLTSYAVNVLMVKQKEPLQYLGMTQTPVFRQGTKAHVDVRTNKADQSISLLVNGKLIKRWVDQGGFAGQGKGIRLVHQGQGSVRFSNLKIQGWDGRFESPPRNRVQSPNDLMTLRNGDKLVGRVGSATAEEITFMIGETPTQTPHNQIEKIEWGGVTDTLRPLRGGEARAHLLGGDHLTIQLRRIEGEHVHSSSPLYGDTTLQISHFERLDFVDAPTTTANGKQGAQP